jgi:hypothetical protein
LRIKWEGPAFSRASLLFLYYFEYIKWRITGMPCGWRKDEV